MNVTIKMLDELVTVQRKFAMSTDKNYKLFSHPLEKYGFSEQQLFLLIEGGMTVEETLDMYRSTLDGVKSLPVNKKTWTGRQVKCVSGMYNGEVYTIISEPYRKGINNKECVVMRNTKNYNEVLTIDMFMLMYSKIYEVI